MGWNLVTNIKGPAGDGGSGVGSTVIGEVPTPTPNGTATNFTMSQPFVAASLCVYLNGLRQRKTIDFVVLNGTQFQLTSTPLIGDSLLADYNPQ